MAPSQAYSPNLVERLCSVLRVLWLLRIPHAGDRVSRTSTPKKRPGLLRPGRATSRR